MRFDSHKHKVFIFLFIAMFFWIGSKASADNSFERQLKNQPLDFTYLTTDQGLSQDNVTAILQDKAGYMWFGTDDGLNRFDGYTFTVYKNDSSDPDSLSNNQIIGIEEETDGSLWIATYRGGLNQFNPITGKSKHFLFNPHNPNDPKGLSQENINVMKQDNEGTLWIGTGRGLDKLDKSRQTFTHYLFDKKGTDNKKINFISSIAPDDQGIIWLGTSSGLIRFDSTTAEYKSYSHIPYTTSTLSDDTITSITLDQTNHLWIGTQNAGINYFDPIKEQFMIYTSNPYNQQSISDNKINVTYADRQGQIWIGTDKALHQFESNQKVFKQTKYDITNPQGLSGHFVYSIYQDRQLNLWVATENGLNVHTPKDILKYRAEDPSKQKLLNNSIGSFYETKDGLIWIGTNDGLQTFDLETGNFSHYLHDPKDPLSISKGAILSIFEDNRGTLWAGSIKGGLNRFNPATKTFTRFNDPGEEHPDLKMLDVITKISQRNDQQLWITSFSGLFIFDIQKGEFKKFPASTVDNNEALFDQSRFSAVIQDKNGSTWFGTLDSGLYQYNPTLNRVAHYPIYPQYSNSLGSNSISTILQDKEGMFWVGTKGGLEKFNPITGSFERFTEKDGLPNNLIWGIVEDEMGFLWLSTSNGISKVNPKTMTFHNYDQADGLQSNDFNSRSFLKTKEGDILFGGNNGFNWIRPNLLQTSTFKPPIVIHSFKVFDQPRQFDQPLSEMKTIQLSYKENFFSFEFAALDYRNTARIQYAYKLDGFDKDWIYSKNRRYISYMNLMGGHYVLHIKATNGDGVWNTVEKTIELEVFPALWQRWWAYILYVLILSTCIILYIRFRIKKQVMKLQEQELIVAARTRDIRSLMDNADQGFLSFGADLIIQKEYSQACIRFFSSNLEGRSIHTLIYPNQLLQQAKLEKQLHTFFEETHLIKKNAYLEQLSCETKLNDFTVQLDFKHIINVTNPEDTKCMLIISDLSTLRQLESQMEEADHLFAMEKLAVLGQLAAGIAHEIRNPLTVIDGFMQIMLKTELEQEKRKSYLVLMHPEVKRINELVSEFLILAKPQAIKYENTSLFNVLKTTVEFMSSEATLHNIEIIADFADKEIFIEMDVKQMKQVFMNVIKNAIEASRAGGQIHIKVLEKESQVEINVVDKGEGISSEQLRKIFDPFFTQKETGTGLGLTTSLNIVRYHHGEIDVISTFGSGTSVIITLPLMKQAQTDSLFSAEAN